MARSSRRAIVREFWKNEIREDADELEQAMVKLIEKKERQNASVVQGQGSSRRYVNRGRQEGHDRLVQAYFSDDPTFTAEIFHRRFRMRRELFLYIVYALQNHSDYFKWRENTAKKKGLSPLQKCTATIRQLAYASPADSLDEYIRMGEITTLDYLYNFFQCVVDVFGARYLRSSNVGDTHNVCFKCIKRDTDFLECWEVSIACIGNGGIVQLLGKARSCNNINVLHGSPLFNVVLQGNAPEVHLTVNGTSYSEGYYLTNEIYREWSSFVKSFSCSMDAKQKKFKERQEAVRKDVERAFGVPQVRWAIIRGHAQSYYKSELTNIIYTCIILPNMIIEDEGDATITWSDLDSPPTSTLNVGSTQEFQAYLQNYTKLRRKETHHQLQARLGGTYLDTRHN